MTKVDEELIEHMSNPQNYGALENPDAIGIGENPENDEKVIITLRVSRESESLRIIDIKFQAIGCMTTVVAGSVITGEAKGLTFSTAEQLVSAALGMLDAVPAEEAACTEMAVLSLRAAMDTYRYKQKEPNFGTITYKTENSCVAEEMR